MFSETDFFLCSFYLVSSVRKKYTERLLFLFDYYRTDFLLNALNEQSFLGCTLLIKILGKR